MHYYIDGYNLLFRILKAGTEVRKQREDLTLDIAKKVNLLELDATLVFDSHYQKDDHTKSHFNSLEIIFTTEGQTADEFILQELKDSDKPSQHTVVTSDKKLAHLCQLRLAKTQGVNEFLAWINKRYRNKLHPKCLVNKTPLIKIALESLKSPSLPLPLNLESSENRFDYYLETFEKNSQQLEKQEATRQKPSQEPKKIKVKKRHLTKEEAQLSALQRWQRAFEKNENREDSDNFIF